MAHDELLRLTGSSGDPEQDISATGSGTARFVGKGKSFIALLRVGGDVTGTSPTLDMRIQQSANGSSGWATIATFTQVTDEQVGYVATTTPRYEVPGEEPLSAGFTTTQDYLRVDYTAGGTTPVFNDVSVELYPTHAPVMKRSGTSY